MTNEERAIIRRMAILAEDGATMERIKQERSERLATTPKISAKDRAMLMALAAERRGVSIILDLYVAPILRAIGNGDLTEAMKLVNAFEQRYAVEK